MTSAATSRSLIDRAATVAEQSGASSALVYLVAGLEVGGALLLLLGLATRLAAAVLAANMTGAILTAGTHVGGPIHLGLAPALLLAMLYLLWAGPGARAVDRRWRTLT